jgi:hypothetical protein
MDRHLYSLLSTAVVTTLLATTAPTGATPPLATFRWQTVVNKNDLMPNSTIGKTFNSFNQPSVNAEGLVVFRARSRGGQQGGGPPTRGIFTRDMATGGTITTITGGGTLVPEPNNILQGPEDPLTTFIEFPSIPRIGIWSRAIATRGNHPPVWEYLEGGTETRAGTSGIYVSDGTVLITGASKLGAVPSDSPSVSRFDFAMFSVPGITPAIPFDVFPGTPAITDDGTIVFKGNYTDGLARKTGVFYRQLAREPAGGAAYVQLVANSDTEVPNPGACPNGTTFGSTAPPSAASGTMVFVGLDNEDDPTCGGIYLAPLEPQPPLTKLVGVGSEVPGVPNQSFTLLGEGLSYDGRFVGFWGAWGTETRIRALACPTEGNRERLEFCEGRFPDGFEAEVPRHQGIFVHDTWTGQTRMVARTGDRFDDFVFWNFSGRVPGAEGEDDGELARWRSSAFVAVSGRGGTVRVAFKASTGEASGIYLVRRPGHSRIVTLVDTMTPAEVLDPEAPAGALITELALERDGFRGRWLVISARTGEEDEEDSMAGIYLTIPERRTPGDFDGDSKADLAVFRPSTGEWFVSGSARGFPGPVAFGAPALGDIPVPADYDGDDKTDLAVFRRSTGEWFVFGSATGFPGPVPFGAPALGDMPVPADYDGDDKTDVAVFRQSTGEWFVLGSATGFSGPVPLGAPGLGDRPVPADYDGDGKADLAVFRTSTGEWFVFGSATGFPGAVPLGAPGLGDVPVPADYDGDGKTDLAVYRGPTGEWFVFGSATGYPGAELFRAAGEIPVPGDYDGDGKVDYAVYRTATAQFFIDGTAMGYIGPIPFGAPGLGDIPVNRPAALR